MSQVAVKKITAREFYELDGDTRDQELAGGEIVQMADGGDLHGTVGEKVYLSLANFVHQHGLGKMHLAGTGFQLAEELVRKPDISFVRAERCPNPPVDGWFPGPPDLAVEIVSPTDIWSKVEKKAKEYLDHGTVEVWLVSPFSRTVQIWRPNEKVVVRSGEDRLETPLLPGFSLRVADLFE